MPNPNADGMIHHGEDFDSILEEVLADSEKIYDGFEALPPELQAKVEISFQNMKQAIADKKSMAEILSWGKRALGIIKLFV